jgi:hypothetical protein
MPGMWQRIRRSGDELLRSLGLLGVFTLWMAVSAISIKAVRPHFINLLYRTLLSFTHFKQTTPWAFVTFDLLQPILLLVFFAVLLHESHGGEAAKIHWRRDGIIGLKSLLLLLIFYYMPLFLWKGVRLVYDDHQMLVSESVRLVQENKQLLAAKDEITAKLTDSQQNAEQRCEQAKGVEIIGLRRRIGEACYLPDRHLTELQRDELFHVLKRIKNTNAQSATIMICIEIPGDIESLNLMAEFQKVFHDAEWVVLGCDTNALKEAMKNSIWRGIVVTGPQPAEYVPRELRGRLMEMGFEVSGGYPMSQDVLHNPMLLVGYKVGYTPPPYPF